MTVGQARRVGRALSVPVFLLLMAGAAPTPPAVRFIDITAAAGLDFTHHAGKTGKKYLPETMGSGVAFFDADGDGWLHLLFSTARLGGGQ